MTKLCERAEGPANSNISSTYRITPAHRAMMAVTVRPTAGEATVQVITPRRTHDPHQQQRPQVQEGRSARVVQRRRDAQVRRWCVANKAHRLGTLTFAAEPSLRDGWKKVDLLRRKLRKLGYEQVLVVPEYGSEGGRLHFHLAVPSGLTKATLGRLWTEGFSDVRRFSRGESLRQKARNLAEYITKEDPADEFPPSARRYSTSKGTAPEVVRFWTLGTLYDAHLQAQEIAGERLFEVWRSADVEEWFGPPTILMLAD